ncbi:hypothetical protein QJQ45_002624 [Haematococcus lacustris]|nr:hypothetical protein QJQ45_002624 [Haematococcus lacustris]
MLPLKMVSLPTLAQVKVHPPSRIVWDSRITRQLPRQFRVTAHLVPIMTSLRMMSWLAVLAVAATFASAWAARVGPTHGTFGVAQRSTHDLSESYMEECDYLRMKAEKRLERSGVVDSATGKEAVSDVRTSEGMFFARAEDAVIESIERRVAEWTLTPVHNGEGLQVLRYKPGQKYDAVRGASSRLRMQAQQQQAQQAKGWSVAASVALALAPGCCRPPPPPDALLLHLRPLTRLQHWDWFFDAENTRNGGNRWSTVLMYLHEGLEEGGETVFPKLPAPGGSNPHLSDCARHALAVRPRKGDAILFHSVTFNGTFEERSMHGACPVLRGEKWSMTKWIHQAHYRMQDKYDEEADQQAQRVADYREASECCACTLTCTPPCTAWARPA